MTTNDDYLYRIFFRVKLYEASGDSFQRLVNELCQHSLPGFQAITPWGNWGDGGNDGWVPEEQHYLQVFGPKPTTNLNPAIAVNKTVQDFQKLLKKWPKIQKYSFVLNDRYTGIPAPIASALQTIETNYKLAKASSIGSAELERMFMGLSEDLRQMIVGGIPSCSLSFIDARAVGELLSGLANRMTLLPTLLNDPSAPNFLEKIAFNGLSSPISDYLRTFSYQTTLVDDFLFCRDPGLQQAISEEVRELYAASKNAIPDTEPEMANIRYAWMIERLIPDIGRQHPHSMKAYRDAAQIVLAKYFETCDVYEYPNSYSAA